MTNLIGFDGSGTTMRVGSIIIADPYINNALGSGCRFEISAGFDTEGLLIYYTIAPIPVGEEYRDVKTDDGTIDYATFLSDYEIGEMVEDESGLKVYLKKKEETVESLQRKLELARHEIHELKDRLNRVTDDYKNGWNAAKDEILSTVKHLEGPT